MKGERTVRALFEGFWRLNLSGRRDVMGITVAALCLVLIACGSDAPPEAAHADGDHEEGTDLFVVKAAEKGAPLPEDLVEQLQNFAHVVRVEKYIRLRLEAFDVVGVAPGAPLRIMTGQPDVHLIEAGLPNAAGLSAGDAAKNLVLVGDVYAQEVGAEIGGTLRLTDPVYDLTVAGTFSTDPAALSRTLIMPLALLQRIYGREGTVTHFWVTVDSRENTHEVIRAAQLALGDAVEVLPRAHA